MKNPETESNISIGPLDIHGILAAAGIVGPLVLIVLDMAAAIAQPGYNLIQDSISSLALTSMGWIQTIGFLFIGLMIEIFTAGLFLNVRRRRGFGFGILLLACFGFGLLMIGAFHTDPVGGKATVNGILHLIATYGVLGLFPVTLALLLPSIRHDPEWKGIFTYTVVTGALALALSLSKIFITDHQRWFGLYERITVANAIVWVEVSAVRLLLLSLRRQRETGETVPLPAEDLTAG